MVMEDVATLATKAYASAESAHKRLDEVVEEVKDIHALTVAVATVNTKVDDLADNVSEVKQEIKKVNEVDNILKDVDEIKTEVRKVSERPKIWWDKMVAAAIGAAASGLVAALLTQILK